MKEIQQYNILGVDSSSRSLKLALAFGGDRLVKSAEDVEQSHGQVIIKKIDELFQSAGLDRRDLDAICVCLGPGSFTGLRIGLAASKGIAVALEIPVVGVSLFEIAAYKLAGDEREISVIVPLTRDEVFIGKVSGGRPPDKDIAVVKDADLAKAVGDGPVVAYNFDFTERFTGIDNEDLSVAAQFDGSELIEMGRVRLKAGYDDDLAGLEPLYIQKSQAEIKYELRHKS